MSNKSVASYSDIGTLTAISGVPLEITHPGTGREMGLRLLLQAIESEAVKPVTRRIENERLKLERTRKGGFNSDQLRQNGIDIISACIIGWEWHDDASGNAGGFAGEQLAFTPANVKKVLEVDWLRMQIDRELMDESRFFQN